MNSNDIITFLNSIAPAAPLELRDFDHDPRLSVGCPTAIEIWHRQLDSAVDADIYWAEHESDTEVYEGEYDE